MVHPNISLARSEMEAAISGDVEAMLAHYTDDVVLHYPGRNPLSGTYHGKDGIRAWMGKVEQLLGPDGSLSRDLHDVLANDEHAVELVSVVATRSDGRSAHWNAAVVMHVHNGKFNEVWLVIDDVHTVDEFLA